LQRDPSAMTPAELCIMREDLGLTQTELATVLGLDARAAAPTGDEPALARSARKHKAITRRSVYRWERGNPEISPFHAEVFARFIAYTDAAVSAIVEAHRPGKAIVTYQDDETFHNTEPDVWPSLPASWHRAVAKQARARIPGARIDFRGE
jgi:transcriptional regulator with XRE-family HTH domain